MSHITLESESAELPPDIKGKVVTVNSIQTIRRKECLEHIFKHLDFKSLSHVSEVCHEWKLVARRPSLWKNIDIADGRISSKFLQTISSWSTQVTSITLQGLKTPKKRKSEPVESFLTAVEGSLETGLEALLKASGATISTMSIISCSNMFTDNVLWIISAFCPLLKRLAYVSAHSPAGKEALWGLGSGCRLIDTLLVPPTSPCKLPIKFDDECCEVIGRTWPHLKVICFGGDGVTTNGLVLVAKLCQDIQIIELDKAPTLTKKVVEAMTYVGLKNLELVELNQTDITADALKALGKGCPKLAKFDYETKFKGNFSEEADISEKTPVTVESTAKASSGGGRRTSVSPKSLKTDSKTVSKRRESQSSASGVPSLRLNQPTQKTSSTRTSRKSVPTIEESESVSTRPLVTNQPNKEEQDRILENKLLAVKRLNAETSQQLVNTQKQRQQRLSEQHVDSQQVGGSSSRLNSRTNLGQTPSEWKQEIKNRSRATFGSRETSRTDVKKTPLERRQEIRDKSRTSNTFGTRENSKVSVAKKTPSEWREEVKSANPAGAKLTKRYQQADRNTNFYHRTLAEQMDQSGENVSRNPAPRKEADSVYKQRAHKP